MKNTITVRLTSRFDDAERVIAKFSGSGYLIEKMALMREQYTNASWLSIVTDVNGKNIQSLLRRLEQEVRVLSVVVNAGDKITDVDLYIWNA